MPAQVTSAMRRFTAAIREFTIAQRTIALIGAAVLVLGAAGLAAWLSQPSYTPLFSGLQAADANSIVEQLRSDSVPYELSDGGATIMVPEEFVYDQRLKAAAAGLPTSSNGGYSLLDNMGVTSSEFQQSVTYKRALEGELAATVSAVKGVRTASVRLAIPKDTVFAAQKVDPTASVFVETDHGVTLSADQVQAIVHLTSASIDGMKPSNVAVIDSRGTVLSAVGVGATGSSDKQAGDYEERVRMSVQTMLDQVVGPGNATVVVAADMNYESAERLEETFTRPDDAPTLSESVDTENYNGSGGTGDRAAGILGPDNIGTPVGADDGAYSSESAIRNNAINKVTESRVIPSGSINRQTVSVAINASAASSIDVKDVTALVSAAAGINATRGDAVTVEVVQFNQVGAEDAVAALAAAEAAATADRFAEIMRTAIITLGIALPIVIILIMMARRSRKNSREQIELGELAEQRAIMNAATVPVSLVGPPKPIGSTYMTEEPIDSAQRRADIDALAEKDPGRTAEFLRSMMDEKQPV